MISRSFRVLCLWLFPSLALPAASWQSDSRLQIDRIRLGTDAEVSFEPQPGIEDPDAASEIQLEPQKVPRSTTDEKYTLYFLPSKVRAQGAGSYFSYDFFVVARARPQSYTRYRVNATSVGSFLDTRKETVFRVGTSEGRIEIPIYCPGRPNLIEVVQAASLTKVLIAGESIRVNLKNLSGLGLLVRVNKADGPGVTAWPPDPKRQYAINPSGTKQLSLDVKPSVFRALTATYAPASLASPHGYLNLGLECEFSDTKSIELEPLSATLPLEFSPSFWHLGGAVAMGAFLGWIFCVLVSMITGYRRTAGIAKLLAKLAVSVLLGWILDIASALTDSRLVLFGFDVNPTRLPPAFVLGVISGVVGAWYLDRVVDYVEKTVSPPTGAAPVLNA
jgi:hypothetical protein